MFTEDEYRVLKFLQSEECVWGYPVEMISMAMGDMSKTKVSKILKELIIYGLVDSGIDNRLKTYYCKFSGLNIQVQVRFDVVDIVQFDADELKGKNFNTIVRNIKKKTGKGRLLTVDLDDSPMKGNVWLRSSAKGKAYVFRSNYDTGDCGYGSGWRSGGGQK